MSYKNTVIMWVVVIIAIVVVAYFFLLSGNNRNKTSFMTGSQDTAAQQQANATAQQNVGGVVVQEVKVGTGEEAVPGTIVSVNYIGKLQNGTVFDQSSNHGGAFQFMLGAGQVIPGWEQGINGMKVGGERILVIPPALGYGAQSVGSIPANSTLIFDVQLVGVSTSTAASAQ